LNGKCSFSDHKDIKTPQKEVAKELKKSRNTLTACLQKQRHVAFVAFEKDNVVLGGRNMVVEKDDSLFIKVKHFKGIDLARPQVWVIGMYERDTKRLLFLAVPKRNPVTLLNLIYKHGAPNTTIYSDCWASYVRIRNYDKIFTHLTVNHDLYFVHPTTGVHTNGVESNWC